MTNFKHTYNGRFTAPITNAITSHTGALHQKTKADEDLIKAGVKCFKKLKAAKIEPLDLKSPDKQSGGTCTPEEWITQMLVEAEQMYIVRRKEPAPNKFALVHSYLTDRDSMTGTDRKQAKEFEVKAVRRSLANTSKAYQNWIDRGCKDADQVTQPAPRMVKLFEERILAKLDEAGKIGTNTKKVEDIKSRHSEYDPAIFASLLVPIKEYIDSLGRAPANSKQVSYDSKGKKRSKK